MLLFEMAVLLTVDLTRILLEMFCTKQCFPASATIPGDGLLSGNVSFAKEWSSVLPQESTPAPFSPGHFVRSVWRAQKGTPVASAREPH